ncbi:hypothetical protein F2Q69_00030026 [Brassica cretica]|uniref:Uncharacterized protein n=1 Tax=Brassica cretica TaxID=69181 RepID=A0A8S9SCN7_BRACR|nr:hypothetical protein F2Q69_00030026 [Brassica cretica]
MGRANHYMPSLKAGSIVKVDRFDVARCSSMYKIIDHPFLICFISPTIIDEVITGAPQINLQSLLDCLTISKCGWKNPNVQGSDLSKETTRVVIRLLIDPCEHSLGFGKTDGPEAMLMLSRTIQEGCYIADNNKYSNQGEVQGEGDNNTRSIA